MKKTTVKQYDQLAERLIQDIQEYSTPLPEKGKEERKERGGDDFLYFCETYLPHHFTGEFSDKHRQIAEEIPQIYERIIVLEAFRGFGKSTFLQAYALHQILYQNKNFIALISDTVDQATLSMAMTIKTELEENERILQDFGDYQGSMWTMDEFITKYGCMVKCFGALSKMRGRKYISNRPDLAICDDFEDDESARNPAIVQKRTDWINKKLYFAMANKPWQIFYLGTPLASDHVLPRLKKKENTLVYHIPGEKTIDGERVPAWPEEFPISKLDKMKKDVGTNDYNQEIKLIVDDDAKPIQEDWITYYDLDEIKHQALRIFTFFDPAFKSKSNNCYKAIITIGVSQAGIIYVKHAFIRRVSVNRFCRQIYIIYEDQHPLKMGGEINTIEEFLDFALDSVAKTKGYRIHFKKVQHTDNKYGRITRLGPYIERGTIRFCKGHSDQDKLVQQLINTPSTARGKWPDGNDGADALEGAVKLFEKTQMNEAEDIHIF